LHLRSREQLQRLASVSIYIPAPVFSVKLALVNIDCAFQLFDQEEKAVIVGVSQAHAKTIGDAFNLYRCSLDLTGGSNH
jgi:hypothetical protein